VKKSSYHSLNSSRGGKPQTTIQKIQMLKESLNLSRRPVNREFLLNQLANHYFKLQ
jgi:hypothetical protein